MTQPVSARSILRALPLLASLGCQPSTPCAEAAAKIKDIYEGCGVAVSPYPDELNHECTPEQQKRADCLLACHEQTSCSDLLSKGINACLATTCK
jgi:hypothetical protein